MTTNRSVLPLTVLVLVISALFPSRALAKRIVCSPEASLSGEIPANVLVTVACNVEIAIVRGNIEVEPGGALSIAFCTVVGNIEGAAALSTFFATVTGNIALAEGVHTIAGPSTVKGNVEVGAGAMLTITGTVEGNVEADAGATVVLTPANAVLGNVECEAGATVVVGSPFAVLGNIDEECTVVRTFL